MNLLSNFLEGDIALLPVGHLEGVEETEYLPHLLVVLLYVFSCNSEITTHLLQHFATNSIELN